MARGRAYGYDTQRAKILSIAAELFANKGYGHHHERCSPRLRHV